MSDFPLDQQFAIDVIKSIVDHPEDVVVDRTIDSLGVLLTVSINKEDLGTVIGKKGQTAKALRTLLRVIGAKSKSKVNMKILEPENDRVHEITIEDSPLTNDPMSDDDIFKIAA